MVDAGKTGAARSLWAPDIVLMVILPAQWSLPALESIAVAVAFASPS
jgi:hypothetical protein